MTQSDRTEEAKTEEAKKAYETPVLVCWGTLREITQAVGNRGGSDGGHGRNKRTDY